MRRPGPNMVVIVVSLAAMAWQYRPVAAGLYVGETWCTDQACARNAASQHQRDLTNAIAMHGAASRAAANARTQIAIDDDIVPRMPSHAKWLFGGPQELRLPEF